MREQTELAVEEILFGMFLKGCRLSKLEHTRGPWKPSEDHDWKVIANDGSLVAEIVPWDYSGCRKEDTDNLKLICKAPEMLEVIRSIATAIVYVDLEAAQNSALDILSSLEQLAVGEILLGAGKV